MVTSMHGAAWAFAIFLLMTSVFSVVILQVVTGAFPDGDSPQPLESWFSSLPWTALTLFQCFLGGKDWGKVVTPMNDDISPVAGVIFSVFVVISLFIIANLFISMLVEVMLKAVREDKDEEKAKNIGDVFTAIGEGDLTWETFASKLESATMVEYFRSIDVSPCVAGARSIFELIDEDNTGLLTTQAAAAGCLRLRGPARALDLALLARDSRESADLMNRMFDDIERITRWLGDEQRRHRDPQRFMSESSSRMPPDASVSLEDFTKGGGTPGSASP
jgi:hypothetical protein